MEVLIHISVEEEMLGCVCGCVCGVLEPSISVQNKTSRTFSKAAAAAGQVPFAAYIRRRQ